METMIIKIMSDIEIWLLENLGTIQFLQFIIPILVSLLSIRFIKTRSRGPALVLDIKDIKEYPEGQRQKIREENYLITENGYLLQVRNEGDSVAVNINIENDNFKMVHCQSHQIGFGINDEKLIRIIKKPGKEIKDLSELNGEIFTIYCENLEGKGFYFKYEIVNMKHKRVRFISKGHGKMKKNKHID